MGKERDYGYGWIFGINLRILTKLWAGSGLMILADVCNDELTSSSTITKNGVGKGREGRKVDPPQQPLAGR